MIQEEKEKNGSQAEPMPEYGKKLNRRSFFKAGAIGATLGAASLVANRGEFAAKTAEAAILQEHDSFPQEIKPDYKRFDQQKVLFSRAWGKKEQPHLDHGMGLLNPKQRNEPGWTHLEHALERASWAVHDQFSPLASAGVPDTSAFAWDLPVKDHKYRFKSKEEASTAVKKAAKHVGASLVGITPYDPRWVYDPLYDLRTDTVIPAKFPFEPKSVIVMAIEMDYEAFGTAPSWIASAAAGKAYSEMTSTATSLAHFMRELGYKAFGAGNDVAMSVPLAIAAGLGEGSRMGTLITYEYGPRVRLCKVFTELELAYDKPKSFGVIEFCERCMRCADACPGKAISKEEKASFKPVCASNCGGVKKWYLDAEKCFKFWGENGGDCGTCITSCPYNKPDFWHHKMVVWATKAAPGPLHSLMREMDIVFGYGNTYDKKATKEWWDK